MIPSIKTIMRTGCEKDVAKKIRLLFEGKLNPREVSEACDKWVRQCYNVPSKIEQILCAVDDLLGNHGTEAIFDESGIDVLYSYSNTGDSYACTIVRDHTNGRWLVTDWGTLVEKMER